MITIETIDHATLIKLAETGVVHSAHVVGQAGGWGILVKYGMAERPLAAQRSHRMRIFRKLDTLAAYLKGVGIPRFEVDAVNYDHDVENSYKRPDRALAMKDAHEAAAYTKWLKAEIQEAIDDPRPSIPNEQVKEHFAKIREALRKRVAADNA